MGNDLISIDTGDFVLFQSSFPRGERPSSSTRIPFLSQFQSTFPRGERRSKRSDSDYFTDFNPRSRVGNDGKSVCVMVNCQRFQSTFPRGERRKCCQFLSNLVTFQSTFPRGERPCQKPTFHGWQNFNPRSRVGNDRICFTSRQAYSFDFNPRSRVGNDQPYNRLS